MSQPKANIPELLICMLRNKLCEMVIKGSSQAFLAYWESEAHIKPDKDLNLCLKLFIFDEIRVLEGITDAAYKGGAPPNLLHQLNEHIAGLRVLALSLSNP